MSDSYALKLAFPDESPAFAQGFEAGVLSGRMTSGTENRIETVVHAVNREMVVRLCAALGWSHETRESEVEGWDYVTLTKDRKAPVRPNPTGLRVV